ncbi:uncharacterized protein ALTATR162_LOCUS5197 [Alternaria atra]|uniref:C3H1-type domain-containing protein n=1 Tax=Alternaria atra TaxID=119953 RepID=A0A8J2I2L9_9PLEO|nr:uncharacterized protein ALTATR162_LOCUS5197 [Alternaria atra]CAG5158670.1 unnamed protein product [Alternaria atra]
MVIQSSSTCALPEGLRYYLLRGDIIGGSMMVPLVPVDQLPFQLQGIPRQLTHRQISDGGWKLCSETNQASSALLIQAPTATSFPCHPSPTAKPRYLAPDHHVRAESQQPRSTPMATFERPSSLTDAFASIYQEDAQRLGYRVSHPSGVEPDPSKKEYCTHWIKTGECDWTAIGCKFKHEMPSIEKLRELGFVRGVPRWWKEKSAIVARPPTWMQRRLAGNEDADQAGEMPEPRAFPDHSTFRARKAQGYDLLGEEVQQPCDIFKRDSSPEQTTAGRLTPPPASVQGPVRRASQILDLLIDLEDAPAPPPGPQLSHTSADSAGSSEAQVSSSRTSISLPSSPSLGRNPSLLIDCKSPIKTITKESAEKEPNIRHRSQLPWASDTEDDTAIPTNPNAKSPRSTRQRRKPPPRSNDGNNNRRPAIISITPTKSQPGLASSKHADSDNAAKNTAQRSKNAYRKMRGKNGGEVGAP